MKIILLLLIIINLLASGAVLLLNRFNRRYVEITAIISTSLSLLLSTTLLFIFTCPTKIQILPYVSIFVDKTSALLTLIVNLIGTFVILYSIDYMRKEVDYARFYSLMLLFIASMTHLILAGNILYLLLHWELVGICSALLISYWWERPAARRAGIKALIMTRISDIGLMILAVMAILVNATDISQFQNIVLLNPTLLSISSIMILIAAFGKSAQFPFHTWLPDAMEGPTPVSALLHSATMVKAGIYLIMRFLPLISAFHFAKFLLIIISLITLYLACFAGLVSHGIKRVLAYSTISSLSLMFLALALGEYILAAMYFLTHSIFKTLLFMVAGIIEHDVGKGDMRVARGLWRKNFKLEGIVFLVGALCAAGLPPLASGFIKECIFEGLNLVFVSYIYYLIVISLSILMSLFMMRAFVIVFFASGKETKVKHIYEPFMYLPTILLFVFVFIVFLPLIKIPKWLGIEVEWLHIDIGMLVGTIVGILLSLTYLTSKKEISEKIRELFKTSFYLDKAYENLGNLFSQVIVKLAAKIHTGRASQGLMAFYLFLLVLLIFIFIRGGAL
ncbi:NADH/Ubiquinone/plastoquinone (complex I) [Methanothermus fervidus DSM 2088]|uniref:NADH/Ubiquinone/plastoquinone (Complex I) n=1 Tax=Methanothermus fervidus (strain ATCC 43054 / DSM 2088 / JCM 10308 / V24 S) TaxID=523846 RepID=E3GYP9_METFV|nr:NADH-quinone oxidoreductase subunit L [Methanothermus fervidus]ADP77431.1 NADH/Ubiquinone/plastoquinone (complex I) [Methanothermus fervidus DSM 2088]